MGQLRRHLRHQFTLSSATLTALAFLLLTSVSALRLNPTSQFTVGVRKEVVEGELTRRRLGGPGSSPPTCRSKCGRCSPCKPVHVPIQPGLSIPLEYYPEAWRCKCADKFFMP
ncbi:EPIDERMAL PATTERNING FACTOR-like protein 4 [Forsythia ovata]|uniref:Epidermal patterning factor-like protein n=1 Tax=Forsythia ovata TaxID=205694 RepID=A0ABD1PJG8_9LAMI